MSFKKLYEFIEANRDKILTEINSELIDLIESYAKKLSNDRGKQQYEIGFKAGVVATQEYIKERLIKYEKEANHVTLPER